MGGPDMATARDLGAFVLAIDPAAFGGREHFDTAMRRYLDSLRTSRAADGASVMAPGDREWAEADRRAVAGIPVDPDTGAAFAELATRYGIALPPTVVAA
jgi:LDH2 family malate/lactate/ureidoglycolate dehydrogenase